MAGRIRTIKPEVLDDELACALTDLAWRVWVSLWVLCDDFGNVRAAPKYLAAQVWQDTARVNDAVKALEELTTKTVDPEQKPMIFLYGADGQTYAHIKGFDKHQRQDNRSKKPRVPAPPEGAEEIQDLRRHLAAKTRKSPRGKSVCTAPPRSGDHDQKSAAGPPTSDLRDPTADHLPPTPRYPSGVQGGQEDRKQTPKPEQRTLVLEPDTPPEPEQEKPLSAHQIVKECYVQCFKEARQQDPPFGSLEGKAINKLLKYMSDDVERACAVIRSTYADPFWQKRATIQMIGIDPGKFSGEGQLPLTGVVKSKDDWVPTDDPAREQALKDGPKEGKAF